MKISLFPSVRYLDGDGLRGKVVIVIDVLRATSVITTAIDNGANEVIVKLEVEETLELKKDGVLIGGERRAKKIEGFDLSNSPLEYTRDRVYGKVIAMTTTNGTRTIHRAASADRVLIGSMLNAKAVAKAAIEEAKDIAIACAGTLDEFSLDDFICAGKIINEIIEIKDFEMDDFSVAAYRSYYTNREDILSYVKLAGHYKYLMSIGLEEDIKYCFTEDIINIVPQVIGESIKARIL